MDVHNVRSVPFVPSSLSYFIDLRSEWPSQDDAGSDAATLSKSEMRSQFLEIMATVADVCHVSIAKKQSTLRTRSIVLPSERREVPVESMAFTITPALVAMCQAGWSEFLERDGDSVSPQVKL